MVSSHFQKAKLKSLQRNAEDALLLELEMDKPLEFKSGQHVALKGVIDNETVYRNYSICSPPQEHKLELGIRVLPQGRFSSWMAKQQIGKNLEVSSPSGRFYLRPPQVKKQRNLFLAAGSGITPVIAMVEDYLETYSTKGVEATLFYVNQTMARAMFLERLLQLKNRFIDRLDLQFFTSREKQSVWWKNFRFDHPGLSKLVEQGVLDIDSISEVYMCGPLAMMEAGKQFFESRGIKPEQIYTEYFAPSNDKFKKTITKTKVAVSKHHLNKVKKVSIILNGVEHSFDYWEDVGKNSKPTLLQSAREQGILLPYACTGGVCGTCRAKLEKGEIKMNKNYALEEDDLKQKFILTCQAVPISDKLKINLDY